MKTDKVTQLFWGETPDEKQENQMEDAYNTYYTKKQISIAKNPNASTQSLTEDFILNLKTIFGVKP